MRYEIRDWRMTRTRMHCEVCGSAYIEDRIFDGAGLRSTVRGACDCTRCAVTYRRQDGQPLGPSASPSADLAAPTTRAAP